MSVCWTRGLYADKWTAVHTHSVCADLDVERIKAAHENSWLAWRQPDFGGAQYLMRHPQIVVSIATDIARSFYNGKA